MTTASLPRISAIAPTMIRWFWKWAPKSVAIMGMAGVPISVIVLSGGPSTVGFWLKALVWVPVMFLFGVLPIGAASLLVLAPLFWLIHKLIPQQADSVVERFAYIFWVLLGTAGYVFQAELGDASHVLLPTSSDNLGALLVIASACATSVGLMRAGGKLEDLDPGPIPISALTLPKVSPPVMPAVSEPEEEFWSDEPAVGWRAWRWDGSALRGVWAAWPSSDFEAECDSCPEPPGWGHMCGIYAIKDRVDLDGFVRDPVAIGRVGLFGDVIEHESGYRASHARIIDLWVTSPAVARHLSALYPEVDIHVGEPPRTVWEWFWQT